MSVEENRNCGCNHMNSCNNNCNYNMTDDDNVTTTAFTCSCPMVNTVDCETREEMMQQIRCYEFAINELALYLDTHPDDQKALCLHRKYAKEAKELKDKYQKVYGPLTINYPCNKWRWLEEPWVSFGLGVI